MTTCKQWERPESLFNTMCSNEFYPVTGQGGCPVCVRPIQRVAGSCGKPCPPTFPPVVTVTFPVFEGNRGATACINFFSGKTYTLRLRAFQQPGRCVYETQIPNWLTYSTITEECNIGIPGPNQSILQFTRASTDRLRWDVWASGNLSGQSPITFGSFNRPAGMPPERPNGPCNSPLLMLSDQQVFGGGLGISAHVRALGDAIVRW